MASNALDFIDDFKQASLYESAYCRLCCEENSCGINLFTEKFDHQDLFGLINVYLPIFVEDDRRHPKTICPGCHIQLQATISFFDLLISGQKKLREILNKNIDADEPCYIQEPPQHSENDPLFGFNHKLHLRVAGLDKPKGHKKGRGRPRKMPSSDISVLVSNHLKVKSENNDDEISDGLSKRKRKCPARLEEMVNGQELEDIYAKEGLINPNEKESPEEVLEKGSEVIGHVRGESGQGLCEVVVNSNSQAIGPKQRTALQFRCDICDITFNQEAKLHKHNAEGHNIHTNSFKSDNNSSSSPDSNHEELDKKNRCHICNKKFRHASSLKGHMLSLHSLYGSTDQTYPCESCDKTFVHLSSLAYHKEAVHSNGKLYACSKCDKTFKHRQLLSRHQSVHSDVRAYFCDYCDSSFKTKANLINHTASHTREKKYYCDICGNQFAYKTSLTLHIRSHTGNKPFECAVCEKRFTQKGNLKEHIRTHTGEKPFECRLCTRKFTTSSQFTLHFKRHIGFKPWKCEYCGKAFLHKNTWRCHLRRHRGEKPYDCKYCEKTFSELWALRKHIRLHTGEKPYACPTCNKTFSDCSNLKKHKKMHLLNDQKKSEEDFIKTAGGEMRLNEEVNADAGEQMWTLISRDSSNDVDMSGRNEQIIYLTYENPGDGNNRLAEQLLISKDELEHLTKKETNAQAEAGENTGNGLNGIFVPTMQVMDEQGNPLKFATNGTLFQVTTMDGEPLQVALSETDQFPLAITANGESIIHQIKPIATSLPIVGDMAEDITVAPRPAEGIDFVPDEQHFKLISELNTAALTLPSEYLEIV